MGSYRDPGLGGSYAPQAQVTVHPMVARLIAMGLPREVAEAFVPQSSRQEYIPAEREAGLQARDAAVANRDREQDAYHGREDGIRAHDAGVDFVDRQHERQDWGSGNPEGYDRGAARAAEILGNEKAAWQGEHTRGSSRMDEILGGRRPVRVQADYAPETHDIPIAGYTHNIPISGYTHEIPVRQQRTPTILDQFEEWIRSGGLK